MNDDSSLARNRAVWAICIGLPMPRSVLVIPTPESPRPLTTRPTTMPLQRMPCGAPSTASVRVRLFIAHVALFGDVQCEELGVAAALADAVDHLRPAVYGAAGDGHLGPLGGEQLGDRSTDAAGGTRHERDATFQTTSHDISLWTSSTLAPPAGRSDITVNYDPVMTRRVAIAGVALSEVGRVDDVTPYALMAQASRRALADAGLAVDQLDGFASTGLGTMAPVDVAEYMGITPRWIDSTTVGGSSWEVTAAHAADAIGAGHADVVLLAYGSTARADLRRGLRTANLDWGARGPMQWEAPYGHTLISKYAMAARRHMHEFGTTIEQLAEIAVSARFNAADNPEAFAPTRSPSPTCSTGR